VRVAHLGVDHRAAPHAFVPKRPERLPAGADGTFLLCIGTNFKHKNRVFALRLLDELRRRHGWDGYFVFAGPHASAGTSAADEAEYLTLHREVARRTIDLRSVTEAEKAWLFDHTKGVVYPTVYEGFGLVPFEAADHGAPCFFANQTAVAELLPDSAAAIIQWDPAATADNVAAILDDPKRRQELVDAVKLAAQPLKWDQTAEQVLEVYELAARDPDRDVATLGGGGGLRDAAGRLSTHDLDELALPPDIYRAFRAFAGRPGLRPWFFQIMRVTFVFGYLLRRGRWPR
jgi:glycosyltransferase involved in cell wall biosynthesis